VFCALAENAQARHASIGINIQANVCRFARRAEFLLEDAARVGLKRRARQNFGPSEIRVR
jgi:hypothetical protein